MSWLYSWALVEEFSRANCSATQPSAPSSKTEAPQAFSCNAKTMATFNHSRSGMTCGPLTDALGAGLLTWFLEASRVRTSALPVAATGWTERAADSGGKWSAWFAKWSLVSSEWKTPQCSLLGDSELFSETWPRSGLMRDGTCYPLPTVAPSICVSASGSLLPTLTVCGNYNAKGASKNSGDGLATALKRLPTLTASCGDKGGRITPRKGREGGTLIEALSARMFPTLAARDYRSPNAKTYAERGGGKKGEQLPNSIGGPLNPDWCEWFMGFPVGWTASRPLETHKFREWRLQHGIY